MPVFRAAVRTQAPDPAPSWALEILESQAAIRADLRSLLALLAPQRRDPIGGAAVIGAALAELGLTRPYEAEELFALAATDHKLSQALDAAGIDDAVQLGSLLGRLYKRSLIDREPRRGAGGWRWIV